MSHGADETRLPLISILMPCFNTARYLTRTLDSVLAQDFEGWELVVHDGGSTDGSLEILHDYAARSGGRFLVESAPDRGQSDALNKALPRSKGQWIGWLNADDLLLPGAFGRVAAAVAAMSPDNPADVVFGSWRIIDADDRLIREYLVDRWTWDQFYREGCYIFSGGIYVRRSVVERLGGWDVALHFTMDFDLALRLGEPVAVPVDATLAALRWHSEAKGSKAAWKFIVEAIRVRKRYAVTNARRLVLARTTAVMAASTLSAPLRFGKVYSMLRSTKRF